MNKLADDLTNPKSMKEMWQTIKSLKSYKQIKPTSRQFSDSDHIAFLHQISSAPDTAECIQMDLPSFDIQTINRTCFSALDLTFVNKDREVFEGNLNWSTSNSKISNSNHFPII